MVEKNTQTGRPQPGPQAADVPPQPGRIGGRPSLRSVKVRHELPEDSPRVVLDAERVKMAITAGKRVSAVVEAWRPSEASDDLPDISLLEANFIEAYFFCSESIAAAKILRTAQLMWRRDLENMDDAETRNAIASLMARVGELQASGALEAVPSDRLARVAKLIGEATEILAADPRAYIPLFRDREADPQTGRKPTALQWFERVWKPRVATGEVLSDDLRRADPVLYTALATAQSRAGGSIGDLVPISRKRLSEMTDDELSERRSRINDKSVERTRRHRQKRNPA